MGMKTIEKRVSELKAAIDSAPRMANWHLQFARAQLDVLDGRASIVETKIDRLDVRISNLDARLTGVEAKLDALPRVLAEMLDERDRRKGAK